MASSNARFQRLALIPLLALIAWPNASNAGLFSSDIKVNFKRKTPSEINLSNIKRIAIVRIENDKNNRIANTLGSSLQNTGAFEILERSQLERLLQEHNLSLSGTIDESSAGQIGAVLGVEALIYGAVNVFRIYDENTQETIHIKTGEVTKTDKKGKTYKEAVYGDIMANATVRYGELDLTLKVVQVETGIILAQRTKRVSTENKKVHHVQANQQLDLPSEGDIEDILISKAVGDNPSRVELISPAVGDNPPQFAPSSFVFYITPYAAPATLEWDKDCKDKEAEQLLGASMFAEALEHLEKITLPNAMSNEKERKKKERNDKELAAIYYNIGLLSEMVIGLEKAEEAYKKALMASLKNPDEKARNARFAVQKQIAAWQAYNMQLPAGK